MIAAQDYLATAAECIAVASRHHRFLELAQSAGGLLKSADRQVNFVPILILDLGGEEQEISSGRKMLALVANDQAREVLADDFQCFSEHSQLVAPNHVHLGVKLQAGYSIAQIQHARSGITLDHLTVFVQPGEMNGFGRGGFGRITAAAQVEE